MSELIYSGGPKRLKAYGKLKSFLSNPGMFCLVVLGPRGAGKQFALEMAGKHLDNELDKEELISLRLNKLNFIHAHDFPADKKGVDSLYGSHLNETIVIRDIESLDELQKRLLLDSLSTKNGKFGFENKWPVRILFTSSENIAELRDSQNAIDLLLWDRISQLLVEFPSFAEEGSNILTDFKNTWAKMEFEKIEPYKELAKFPASEKVSYFLESKKDEFVGNFRDLDKLACLYFNYRIFHYGDGKKIDSRIEDLVFEDVKSDFSGKTQMSVEQDGFSSIFDFAEVKSSDDRKKHPTLDDFNNQYRIHFRRWLLQKHPTLSKAAESLNCSIHTLKNYKEGKATKAARNPYKKGKKAK